MFLLGFFDRSLWSVLSEETNESPSHKFPFWWCSVFLRQTEQNLSPHFWHWEWPSCVFDKLEGDVHFGQGRSLTTVWLDNGCGHTEVLGDFSTWSPLSFRGMLTLILLSGSFDRFLTDIVLLPWFSCGEKIKKNILLNYHSKPHAYIYPLILKTISFSSQWTTYYIFLINTTSIYKPALVEPEFIWCL